MSLCSPDANYEQTTGTFADATPYDSTPLSSRNEAHYLAQHLAHRCNDDLYPADVHFLDPWENLLNLPFPKRSWHSGLQRAMPLKCLTVDGRPALRSIKLARPLDPRLQRRRSTRRFERWILKHARTPELLWTASPAPNAPMTATASGSVRGWIDLGREAILQSVIYAALTYQVTGAALGLCVFRASFGRMFALNDRVIAMEDIRSPSERETMGRVPHVLDADEFSHFAVRMKDDTIEERLPFTFLSEEEGTNDAQLEALSNWTHAAYRLMLKQPRNGRFSRLPRVKSDLVEELLARVDAAKPGASPMSRPSTGKRKSPSSSPCDSATKCRRLEPPRHEWAWETEAESLLAEVTDMGYDGDDEGFASESDLGEGANETEPEHSEPEDQIMDIDDSPIEMPEAVIDHETNAYLGARYMMTPKGRGPSLSVYAKIVRALDMAILFVSLAEMSRLIADLNDDHVAGAAP